MKLSDKIYLLFVAASITAMVTLFSSCKSTKNSNCDAYGDAYFIRTDSMIVVVDHCHNDKEHYCYYSLDTIRLTK